MKSRWADDEEDAALEAQLKREKEDKKRQKAEKQRKADEAAAALALKQQQQQAQADAETQSAELSSRPSKRRKLSPEPEAGAVKEELPPAKLLRFPGGEWKKCRSVEDYEKLNDIEEGAYGWVSRAKDTATGKVVALKRLKMDNANDGIPVTGLREIQTLMDCEHPNIVALREVVVGEDTSKIEKYVFLFHYLHFSFHFEYGTDIGTASSLSSISSNTTSKPSSKT
jgi:cell division cycle 2-like protein